MANFISDFFENREWLGVVQQNATTGAFEVGGASVNPSVVYDTWVEVQAIPKTAANDGLIVVCKDVGVGGSTWRYSHANLRWYVYGRCILASNASDVTHGATLTTEEVLNSAQLMNDGTTSILHDGDTLRVIYTIVKTGTTDSIRTATNIHTASGTAGTDVKVPSTVPGATTVCYKDSYELKRISATSMRNMATAAAVAADAASGTNAFLADVTVSNLDTTAEIWLNSIFYATGTTDTAMICKDYYVELLTRGA